MNFFCSTNENGLILKTLIGTQAYHDGNFQYLFILNGLTHDEVILNLTNFRVEDGKLLSNGVVISHAVVL